MGPKHLLNGTEVTTYGNEVETYYVKMLNGLIPYSGQIFRQNPLFFIIQVNQRQVLFYLKVLRANNFPQFDKCPGKYTSKTGHVETEPVCK